MTGITKVTFVIEGRLAGLNEYTASCRTVNGKYFKGNTVKQREQKRVCVAAREALKGIQFEHPVQVDFRWYEENKKRDLDNICFAKKFILDGLVDAGVLKGDSQKYVRGLRDCFLVDKEHPRVEVVIYRL